MQRRFGKLKKKDSWVWKVPENTYTPTPGLDGNERAEEEKYYADQFFKERQLWEEANHLMQQVRGVARSMLTSCLS